MKETEFEKYFQRPCQYCGECSIWATSEGDPSPECKQAVKNGTCTCFGRYVGFDELGNNDIMKQKYIILLNKHYLPNETEKSAPEIHAHWIQKYPNSEHPDIMYCSHCNFYVEDKINNVEFTYKFCPNCDAIMDEEKK